MTSSRQGDGGVEAAIVQAALDSAGITGSAGDVGALVGIRQLVRSRADLLFTPDVDCYEPADVFNAAGPAPAAEA